MEYWQKTRRAIAFNPEAGSLSPFGQMKKSARSHVATGCGKNNLRKNNRLQPSLQKTAFHHVINGFSLHKKSPFTKAGVADILQM